MTGFIPPTERQFRSLIGVLCVVALQLGIIVGLLIMIAGRQR